MVTDTTDAKQTPCSGQPASSLCVCVCVYTGDASRLQCTPRSASRRVRQHCSASFGIPPTHTQQPHNPLTKSLHTLSRQPVKHIPPTSSLRPRQAAQAAARGAGAADRGERVGAVVRDGAAGAVGDHVACADGQWQGGAAEHRVSDTQYPMTRSLQSAAYAQRV